MGEETSKVPSGFGTRLLEGTDFEFRYREPVLAVVCLAGYAVARAVPDPWTGPELWVRTPALCLVGFAWALFSLVVRVWATGHVHFGAIADRERDVSALATSGPYAIVRHPLYFAMWWGVGAIGWIFNLWGLLVVWAGIALQVVRLARLEDRGLGEAFGDAHAAYAARVPRLVPRSLRGLGAAFRAPHDWIYGLKGNIYVVGLALGYLVAAWTGSLALFVAFLVGGHLAQLPFSLREIRARRAAE